MPTERPLDTQDEIGIVEAVDAAFDAQIALTQDLVRCPSIRGQEATAQDLMYREMAKRGLAMDRWTVAAKDLEGHPGFSPVKVDYAQAINVVGTHRPAKGGGRSLILNGHVDVVPTGPVEMWSSPPFEPRIEGDWMYGRGAGDMKSGVIANLFALDAIRTAGFQPAGTVHMQSVVEEESTGNGALAMLVRGYKADAALISEPTGMKVVRANLGVLWFQVTVRGYPVHVSHAGDGSNAIEAAFALVQALRRLEAKWNAPEKRHPRFAANPHPLNLNIGKIAGGDWASSVPAWCTFDARIAIYPGQKPKEAAAEIEACIREASAGHGFLGNNPPEILWNGFWTEGYELEEGSDAEAALAAVHRRVNGTALGDNAATAYLDARVFALYGDMPALTYGARMENAHGFDERVNLPSLRQATKTIALFIAEWCGLEPMER